MRPSVSSKMLLSRKIRVFLISSMAPDETIREFDLSQRFSVSRTPVREALNELEKQAMIVRRKKAGTSLPVVSVRETVDIWDVRSVLEGHAARLFCRHVDLKTIHSLTDIEDVYQDAVRRNNFEDAIKNDILFHETIINSCGNAKLACFVRDCNLMPAVFRRVNVPTHRRGSVVKLKLRQLKYPHSLLIKSLIERDEKKAEYFMRRHIEWTLDTLFRDLLIKEASFDNTYFHKDFHGRLSLGIEYPNKNYGPDEVREYLKNSPAPITRH